MTSPESDSFDKLDATLPTMAPTETPFMLLSRNASVRHATRLGQLAGDVASIYPIPENVSYLALTDLPHISGVTHPIHGLVGMQPSLFATPEVAVFTAVHEAVHAQLGNTLAKAIDSTAPGFREHFHGVLVPAWLDGSIEFKKHEDYIRSRWYDGLVPGGWRGPHAVNFEILEGTLQNYFSLVSRDMITKSPTGDFRHTSPHFRDWESVLEQNQPVSPDIYAGSPEWLSEQIITGMSVGSELLHYTLNKSSIDLLTWEEALANRIASDLTGMSLEDVQQIAPQDPVKLEGAYFMTIAGLHGEKLAETIRSPQDLENLIREHF